MTERAAGQIIRSLDLPATVYDADNTDQLNLTTTGYQTGAPEVGVYFIAATSGRVLVTVGGGTRDNGAGDQRVFLAPQVFERDTSGTEVLAPSITLRGFCAPGESAGYCYGSRTSMLEGLTPGQVYYARVMLAPESVNDTADVNCREITVEAAS